MGQRAQNPVTRRLRGRLAVAVLLLTSVAAAASPALGGSVVPVGKFRWTGGPPEQKALEQAIDTAVAEMSWAVRWIGRSKLRSRTAIPAELQVEQDGDAVVVRFTGRAPMRARIGAPGVPWTAPDGTRFMLTYSVQDGHLVQSLSGEEGSRRTELVTEGRRVILLMELASARLPHPLRYRLTYEAVSAPER